MKTALLYCFPVNYTHGVTYAGFLGCTTRCHIFSYLFSYQATDVGAELSFILPTSGSSQFPILFEKLEGTNVCTYIYLVHVSVILCMYIN